MANKSWRRTLLALTACAAMLVAGCGGEEKVGVVDFERVVKESGQSQQIAKDIAAKQNEIITRLEEAQANSSLSEEEFAQKEQEAKRELMIFQMSKQQQFEALIQSQAALIAKDKKLGAILHDKAVHYNGEDITDELLTRLNAADKNAKAAAKENAGTSGESAEGKDTQ